MHDLLLTFHERIVRGAVLLVSDRTLEPRLAYASAKRLTCLHNDRVNLQEYKKLAIIV